MNQTAVALYKVGGVLKEDARLLQKQDVDSDALPYLTDDVLSKMGVPTFGRRVKIMKAAQAILSGAAGLAATAAPAAIAAAAPTPSLGASQAMTSPAVRSSTSSFSPSPVSTSAPPARRPEPEADQPSSSPMSMSASGPVRGGAPAGDDEGEVDDADEDDMEREFEHPAVRAAAEREAKAAEAAAARAAKLAAGGEDDLFGTEEASTGDSFMAVKPWIGAMKEPSKPPKFNNAAPDRKLSIDWVHGFRAFDSRSNLVYNAEGDVVYPVAGLLVVYNLKQKKQRYFQGHNDDVRCMAQHPVNKNVIASGQNATIVNGKASPPSIQVWDSSNPENGKVFLCKCVQSDRAIRCVAFVGEGGKYLASVSNDDNHCIKVWDWKTGTKICEAKGDANPIFALRGNPKDPSEFVTVGSSHIMFWRFDGSSIKGKRASAGGAKPLTFYSIAFSESGFAVAGGADGNVYVFKGGVVSKVFPWHPKGKVLSIEPLGSGFVSGGSDHTVRVWDAKLAPAVVHTFGEWVTSVWPAPNGQDMLVGTRAGDVFELRDFASLAPIHGDADLDAITRGHGDGELWALAVVKGGNNFVTAGEDNTICLWDVHKHKMLKRAIISDKKGKAPIIKKASTTSKHPTNQCARGVAISPDKKSIIVGTNNGEVAVFDTKTLVRKALVDLNDKGKRQITNQVGNWIQTIQFSPSGRTCAVGTHGSVVCLLDPLDGFKCKGVLSKSSSAISSLDWSEDSSFIQTNDLGYELLFYAVDEDDLSRCKQVTSASAMRDVAWATHTCKLGWPVQGIFDPSQGGQDINSVDVNPTKTLVVTGDDNGDVKLFRYPCAKGAKADSYGGHSSHVVTTRFTPDEKFVISTGGHDLSIIQWALSS